jgi:peroxiredoxin
MMKRMHAMLSAAVVLLLLFSVDASAAGKEAKGLQVGDVFPSFALPEEAHSGTVPRHYSGKSISDLSDGLLFLVVSGWFCPPCHKEVPALKQMYARLQEHIEKGEVAFFSVSVGDGVELARRFAEKNAVPWPIFPDPEYRLHSAMGDPLIPTLYVVDAETLKIIRVVTGMFEHDPEAFLRDLPFLRALPLSR